jgi:acyl carrier protein
MEKLNKILLDVFRIEDGELSDDLTIEDIQLWDSLTHMALITSIENSLKITFTMQDIMIMRDIKTIKSIVRGKLA